MKTGIYALYLKEYRGYFVKVYFAGKEDASFLGTVERSEAKRRKIRPKTYKTLKGAERGISAITRKHFYTQKEDVEIVELTTADIDVMGLYDLII